MSFMEKKDLYPQTYKLIKQHSFDRIKSIKRLSPDDTFEVVGTFLNECFTKYPSDEFLDVLMNEHIAQLMMSFFTCKDMSSEFRLHLFVLVSQEFEVLFDELFDEAHEDNLIALSEEAHSIMATHYRSGLRLVS